MIKVLATAIWFLSLITYCNYSYSAPKTIEYFAGHRDTPKLLSTDELKKCINASLLLEKSQEIEKITGLLNEEFLETNKKVQDLYSEIYSKECAGASYFKEDFDSTINILNSPTDETILNLLILSWIDMHLDFPMYNEQYQSYIFHKNLLENKYFMADPSYNPLLGLTVTDESVISLSNMQLHMLGFRKDNKKSNLPDEQAVFNFKLHLQKKFPYYIIPASPLYNLDIKTVILLKYCSTYLDKCMIN